MTTIISIITHLLFLSYQNTAIEYNFAFDEPELLSDGRVAEMTWNKLLTPRVFMFDETPITLTTETDKSGTRSVTFVNEFFNQGGQRSTQGADNVIAGIGATLAGEILPSLIIYSSSAQTEDKMAMNDEWARGFGKVRGKFGHKRIIKHSSYL